MRCRQSCRRAEQRRIRLFSFTIRRERCARWSWELGKVSHVTSRKRFPSTRPSACTRVRRPARSFTAKRDRLSARSRTRKGRGRVFDERRRIFEAVSKARLEKRSERTENQSQIPHGSAVLT